MTRSNLWVLAVLAGLLVPALGARAEQVENPMFSSWAKQTPGTSSTLVIKTTSDKGSMTITNRSTLVEITADAAVVDLVLDMEADGQKLPQQKRQMRIARTAERDDPKEGQLDAAALEAAPEETLTVPAGTFKTKVVTFEGEQQGMKVKVRTWYSADAPGGTVKMDMTGEGAQSVKLTGELVGVEKK